MKVYCNNKLLINDVELAETFVSKLVGLLNRKYIIDEGLLLKKCSSIHCFFMKFTIDAIYLSSEMVVLEKETILPWRIGKFVKNTANVLELPEGKSIDVKIGDLLIFTE